MRKEGSQVRSFEVELRGQLIVPTTQAGSVQYARTYIRTVADGQGRGPTIVPGRTLHYCLPQPNSTLQMPRMWRKEEEGLFNTSCSLCLHATLLHSRNGARSGARDNDPRHFHFTPWLLPPASAPFYLSTSLIIFAAFSTTSSMPPTM